MSQAPSPTTPAPTDAPATAAAKSSEPSAQRKADLAKEARRRHAEAREERPIPGRSQGLEEAASGPLIDPPAAAGGVLGANPDGPRARGLHWSFRRGQEPASILVSGTPSTPSPR